MKIQLSSLKNEKRLDPEFFTHNILLNDKPHKLSDLASLRVGKTPSNITPGKTPFYRVSDIRKFTLKSPKLRISQDSLDSKFIAKHGDILLSTKGRVGDAAIVIIPGFYNQDLTRIRAVEIDPVILTVILNSSDTNKVMMKYSTNQMHPFLALSKLKNIPITQPNKKHKEEIRNLYKRLTSVQSTLSAIDKEIDVQFKSHKEITQPFHKDDLKRSKRMDPEFFLDRSSNTKKISSLQNVSVKIGSYKNTFTKTGLPYLRSQDLSQPDTTKKFVDAKTEDISTNNEILITRVGIIKAIYITNERLVPSDNFIRIKINDPSIDNKVICEYFNSKNGQDELSKHMQGSMQRRINKKTILNFPLPSIPHKNQQKIISLILVREKNRDQEKEIISILSQPTFWQQDPQASSSSSQ